jgi:hypothetical protein
MSGDISPILRAWEYDPNLNLRKIVADDGAACLQVRVSEGAWEGILQMRLDGRPDGRRPHGCEFALDHYKSALERHRAQAGGDTGFVLDKAQCAELFDECGKVYSRYVLLLGLKDYERVVRDTERNMEAFRFVHGHGAEADDRMNLEKWWPYILRINAVARAMIAARDHDRDKALRIVEEAIARIESLDVMDSEEFYLERERATEHLAEVRKNLMRTPARSDLQRLQEQMREAVARENFELAARLRDKIRAMKQDEA